MQEETARHLAFAIHAEARDRTGRPVVEHLARVAAAVPPHARSAAWLHHVAEHAPSGLGELRDQGLSATELEALELLARIPSESYELYVLRVAYAWAEAGALARTVKVADLDDRLCGDVTGTATPPYAWARRRIAVAHAQQLVSPAAGVAATG
jgi:hypothetical protein